MGDHHNGRPQGPPLQKYRLAAEALAIWQKDVRPFAPDEHLRWQRLLAGLPDDATAAEILPQLSALAAKNEQEQLLFRQVFERARAMAEAIPQEGFLENFGEKRGEPVGHRGEKGFYQKNWTWLLALALLAGGLAAWLVFSKVERKTVRIEIPISVAGGQRRVVCPDSLTLAEAGIGKQRQRTPFSKKDPKVFEHVFKSENVIQSAFFEKNKLDSLATLIGSYSLSENGCIDILSDKVSGRDTLLVKAETGKGTSVEITYLIEVIKINDGPVVEETKPKYLFEEQPIPFDHSDLLRKLAIEPPTGWQKFLSNYFFWIKTGLLALLAGLLYLLIIWRANRRRKLTAVRERSDRPPYVWNIRISGLLPPDPGDGFQLALHSMRRRTADIGRLLDLPATVKETIRRGGMADFRFRQQTKPPEYLMLIDRQDVRDHRARLYDDLHRLFLKNDVLMERFFFDGDLRVCHNENHPDGIGIEELLFKFGGSRLMVIGQGRQLFSTTTGRPAKWTERLALWKDRALLSPLPIADWGRRERQLGELFRLAPASVEGIQFLLDAFEADDEARLPDFSKHPAMGLREPILLEKDLKTTLEKHFPDKNDRLWVAACAIWPEVHYDLTLWLGHWLAQETGQPICTVRRLTGLLRLPWFAAGSVPPEAREELLAWLKSECPGLREKIARALHDVLGRDENRPPEDSAAWDDFAMRLAFNEWKGTTDPRRKKELEAQIARMLDRGVEPDFVVVKEFEPKKDGRNLFDLPDEWKKRLFKGGLRGLGLRESWRDGLAAGVVLLAAAVGIAFWAPPKMDDCAYDTVEVALENGRFEICPATRSTRMLLWEYQVQEAARLHDLPKFDSLIAIWPELTTDFGEEPAVQEPLYGSEVLINKRVAAFNAGVFYYQKWEATGQPKPQKDSACLWFTRSLMDDDAKFPAIGRAVAWCSGDDLAAQKLDIRPNITGLVLDKETGRPIDGVAVSGPKSNVRTDRRGRFLLKNMDKLGGSVVALAFSKEGFEPFTGRFSIEAVDTLGRVFLKKIPQPFFTKVDTDSIAKLLEKTTNADSIKRITVSGNGDSASSPDSVVIAVNPQPADLLLPDLIKIDGGTFQMGFDPKRDGDDEYMDDAKPLHRVTLSDFYLAKTEVTQSQWRSVMGEDPPELRFEGCDECPVENVSWDDIQDFLKKLNALTGQNYRLPTEAEWEFAARGGGKSSSFKYSGSNNLDEVAWFRENSDSKTHPVGKKKANELGLFDMSGNVYEWCQDVWHDTYNGAPSNGSAWTSDVVSGRRVVRGGSWYVDPIGCRAAYRSRLSAGYRNNNFGFRLARN